MGEILIRVCEIQLSGFKNINCGVVELPASLNGDYFSKKADVLGIYGQNGSGKTAVIEAMNFIQRLLTGKSLPADAGEYIARERECATIAVTFALDLEGIRSKVEYLVDLMRQRNGCGIVKEALVVYPWNNHKFETKKTLLCFKSDDTNGHFTPDYRYKALIRSNEENRIHLGVARRIAQIERCSVIFGKEGRQIFLGAPKEVSADYAQIIQSLHNYAAVNLFIISNAHSGSISFNLMIPFAFRLDMGETIAKGDLPISLDGPSVIYKKNYQIMQQILAQMNLVLSRMIPGLTIGFHDYGEQLMDNGTVGHKVELISRRDTVIIPLKYESEGIIKIISVLNVLMCVYNNPSMCLIIDELDAGIYEYLLGELLSVFHKGARGQLVFTSHNLRPLEMLDKSSILFSTTNPDHRYMRLQNVKTNNNLRDLYLRSITLGGQREEVYAETDTVEIGRAFRRAGKAVRDGGKD